MSFLAAGLAGLIPGVGKAVGDTVTGIGNAVGGQTGYQAATPTVQNPFANPQVAGAMNAQQAAAGQSGQSLDQQQQLISALQAQGGLQNQSQVYGQQQALAGQLSDMAQGGGPNPALAQLANTTGQNIAQQSALMAGQRGAGANAGLMARQVGMQGGALQQNAVGQAAALRAQQQLGAINALQGQQNMMGNLATTQAGQQIGATNAGAQLAQAQQGLAQSNQSQMLGAQQGYSGQQLQSQLTPEQINAQVAMSNASNGQKPAMGIISGLGSAASSVGPSAMKAIGFAEGGPVAANSDNSSAILKENYKGKSKIGALLMSQGGRVHNMKNGGHVPGKPVVGGAVNNYANDTVDARLSPGEIVLPRSVTQSSDPAAAAARFVAAIKSRKGNK